MRRYARRNAHCVERCGQLVAVGVMRDRKRYHVHQRLYRAVAREVVERREQQARYPACAVGCGYFRNALDNQAYVAEHAGALFETEQLGELVAQVLGQIFGEHVVQPDKVGACAVAHIEPQRDFARAYVRDIVYVRELHRLLGNGVFKQYDVCVHAAERRLRIAVFVRRFVERERYLAADLRVLVGNERERVQPERYGARALRLFDKIDRGRDILGNERHGHVLAVDGDGRCVGCDS